MKLVVFGASGGTGQEIIVQALDQGHEVTAFVRDPKKLAIKHGKLRIIEGDVLKDQSAMLGRLRGRMQSSVLSAWEIHSNPLA